MTDIKNTNGNTEFYGYLDNPYLVDIDYLKDFMTRYELSVNRLSILLKISSRRVEDWLNGKELINPTAATLILLIDQIPGIVKSYHEQALVDPEIEFQIKFV